MSACTSMQCPEEIGFPLFRDFHSPCITCKDFLPSLHFSQANIHHQERFTVQLSPLVTSTGVFANILVGSVCFFCACVGKIASLYLRPTFIRQNRRTGLFHTWHLHILLKKTVSRPRSTKRESILKFENLVQKPLFVFPLPRILSSLPSSLFSNLCHYCEFGGLATTEWIRFLFLALPVC